MASAGTIDQELEDLLHGRPKAESTGQPDMVLSDSGTSSGSSKKGRKGSRPIVGDTICYVVAAVVFNDEGEVLLTREGFHPCYGKWYLPAGRVDSLETLEEAAIREVREETGLELKATSLLVVENPSADWFRFTFTGRITGGNLRTQEDADDETLEAGWWDVDTVRSAKRTARGSDANPMESFQLRGGDIVRLIELVRRHIDWAQTVPAPAVQPVLPAILPLQKILLRPVILHHDVDGYSVLCCGESDMKHIPVIDTGVTRYNTKNALLAFMEAMSISKGGVVVHGLLAVEHDGRERHRDGLCLSVLLSVPATSRPRDSRFRWHRLGEAHVTMLCDARKLPDAAISLLGL